LRLLVVDAEAAFQALRERPPDAVVLDLDLVPRLAEDSESEGLAVLGAVIGGRRGRIPVVIATDSDEPDAAFWCGRLGASTILRKRDGLSQIIRAAVEAAAGSSQREAPPNGE